MHHVYPEKKGKNEPEPNLNASQHLELFPNKNKVLAEDKKANGARITLLDIIDLLDLLSEQV